jgi:hypothetical protein
MKKLILLIVILCYNTSVFSQEKIQNINIWHFSALSTQHKELIVNLKGLLGKKVDKKYIITIISAYNNEKVILRAPNDTFYLAKEIENNFGVKEDEIINNIEASISTHITYNEDIRKKIGKGTMINSINEIAKLIKKNKKGDFDIIWLNAFVPVKNSVDYLENLFLACKKNNDFSILMPVITQPYDRQQLKPVDNYYEFTFPKVDYFNNYEIDIFLKKQGHVIYRKTLSVSRESIKNKSGYIIMKGDKCYLYIDEELLATECYVKLNNIIDTKSIEKLCIPCESKDLYHNFFMLRIRGVKDNFYKEELWTEPIMFQFQCTRG